MHFFILCCLKPSPNGVKRENRLQTLHPTVFHGHPHQLLILGLFHWCLFTDSFSPPPASQKVCLEDNRAGIQGVGQIRRRPELPIQRAGFRGSTGGLHVDFRKTLQRGRCVFVSHRLSVALPSGSPHLPLPYPRSVLLWGVFGGCCPSNNVLHTASL